MPPKLYGTYLCWANILLFICISNANWAPCIFVSYIWQHFVGETRWKNHSIGSFLTLWKQIPRREEEGRWVDYSVPKVTRVATQHRGWEDGLKIQLCGFKSGFCCFLAVESEQVTSPRHASISLSINCIAGVLVPTLYSAWDGSVGI